MFDSISVTIQCRRIQHTSEHWIDPEFKFSHFICKFHLVILFVFRPRRIVVFNARHDARANQRYTENLKAGSYSSNPIEFESQQTMKKIPSRLVFGKIQTTANAAFPCQLIPFGCCSTNLRTECLLRKLSLAVFQIYSNRKFSVNFAQINHVLYLPNDFFSS